MTSDDRVPMRTTIECHSLAPADLARFLERQKAVSLTLRTEIDLDVVLEEILQKAYEFVPSESGSILLDDPFRKLPDRKANELVFIATFGPGSENLVGQRMSAAQGIAGHVYQSGSPYLSRDVGSDQFFFSKIDSQIGFKTHSIVAVPIYIGKTVCGVLELINRSDGRIFDERDMTLLEIFAGYTSFMLQNALDAKRAHELAKRDDLTGLYNDRWFHVRLSEEIDLAEKSGRPCTILFMDLDNFKLVNDRHGHLAGSQVLREVGYILKRHLDGSALASRYGGDEFVMILPGMTLDEGAVLAEDIRKAVMNTTFLEHEYGFGLPPLHLRNLISASIGVACHRPGARAMAVEMLKNDLLRRADVAMYEAKARGRNKVALASDGDVDPVGSIPKESVRLL